MRVELILPEFPKRFIMIQTDLSSDLLLDSNILISYLFFVHVYSLLLNWRWYWKIKRSQDSALKRTVLFSVGIRVSGVYFDDADYEATYMFSE